MQHNDAQQLLQKYREGMATDAEKALLADWVQQDELPVQALSAEELEDALAALDAKLPLYRQRYRHMWPRMIAVAASVVIVCSFAAYFLLRHNPAPAVTVKQSVGQDLAPGGNKAVLILAGGNTIVLDEAKNGTIASQGNTTVNKTADGQLVYSAGKQGMPDEAIRYNTVVTPRGGQYHLVLSDGTGVWLNAESSVQYPVSFTRNSREVFVTGEVYFEVVENKSKPFLVNLAGQRVEVLGTRFNISAYAGEAQVKTTLLEGAVRVHETAGGRAVTLKPGQQAQVPSDAAGNSAVRVIDKEDADNVIAWKNGYFYFEHAGVKDVMEQLGRWYDVAVVYEGALPEKLFNGKISRQLKLSEALERLAYFNVHFYRREKSIVVTANSDQ